MALSTYQWRPPDTGDAAAAWLRGQALGLQEREFQARQQALAVEQQQRQQQLAQQKEAQTQQLARQMRADAAADRRLGVAEARQRALDTQRGLDNAPYRAPGGLGGGVQASGVSQAVTPATAPTTNALGMALSATGLPGGIIAQGVDAAARGNFRTAEGSVFGLVPDGRGGLSSADPNDRTDAGVPGFDPNRGAWGANIKDPNLKGVALTPRELALAGVNMQDPSSHLVEVAGKDGVVRRYPIVDKLGKEGRIDFTGAAYNELGGPQNRNGGTIPNLQYRIVPAEQQASPRQQATGAARVAQQAELLGLPTKQARALVGRAILNDIAPSKATTTGARVKSTYRDGKGGIYTQLNDGSWLNDNIPPPGTDLFDIGVEKTPAAAKDTTRLDANSLLTERGQVLSALNKARKDLATIVKDDPDAEKNATYWIGDGSNGEKGKKYVLNSNGTRNDSTTDAQYNAAVEAEKKLRPVRERIAREEARAADLETRVQGLRQGSTPQTQAAAPAGSPNDLVAVVAPNGKSGKVKRSELADALKAGYKTL